MLAMETRLSRVRAGLGPRAAEITDRSPWDWYAESGGLGAANHVVRRPVRERYQVRFAHLPCIML